MAPTPTRTAAPAARRIHSPVRSDPFNAENTRPPNNSAAASEVHAPAAYASSSNEVPALAPLSAAPVRISPRIGPAQGAHNKPVPMPSTSGDRTDGRADEGPVPGSDSRKPSATSGLLMRSAHAGSSSVRPNAPSRAMAAYRPSSLSATTQPPPTAASVAMPVKASAIPSSIGRPCERNGRSARANTKGSTGRMQGLRMVSTPPR
jgi:hypothetical protein